MTAMPKPKHRVMTMYGYCMEMFPRQPFIIKKLKADIT